MRTNLEPSSPVARACRGLASVRPATRAIISTAAIIERPQAVGGARSKCASKEDGREVDVGGAAGVRQFGHGGRRGGFVRHPR